MRLNQVRHGLEERLKEALDRLDDGVAKRAHQDPSLSVESATASMSRDENHGQSTRRAPYLGPLGPRSGDVIDPSKVARYASQSSGR
ncbi:hypothetical protein GCM10009037_17290 [Halarchaeum grantii]|uniref:Transposase n=1 Tax=Halarchaeum grantii TaxID=1193105 RepID=A0A830FCV9_9EURY|nr:hypothetical protein GCM10009037_17290 [Halarchaeum grantii]